MKTNRYEVLYRANIWCVVDTLDPLAIDWSLVSAHSLKIGAKVFCAWLNYTQDAAWQIIAHTHSLSPQEAARYCVKQIVSAKRYDLLDVTGREGAYWCARRMLHKAGEE